MAILGIDAAWTTKNPTGVALLSKNGKLVTAAPSYSSFLDLSDGVDVDWSRPASPEEGIDAVLLAAARLLPNDPVNVIAIDMPVSKSPITGRRNCDQVVSKDFGANGCGTHSPSLKRPGIVSQRFSAAMDKAGFNLATASESHKGKTYIEVYPHTALLRLMNADYRLPYKQSKRAKYWPKLSTPQRKQNLLNQWKVIVSRLEGHVGETRLPLDGKICLKSVEDAIDGVICAWVGYEYSQGRAECMGDDFAAIWTPCQR